MIAPWHTRTELVRIELILALLEAPPHDHFTRYANLLLQVQGQDRVQRPGAGGPEEPPRRYPGGLRRLRHQEVPHRQAGLARRQVNPSPVYATPGKPRSRQRSLAGRAPGPRLKQPTGLGPSERRRWPKSALTSGLSGT